MIRLWLPILLLTTARAEQPGDPSATPAAVPDRATVNAVKQTKKKRRGGILQENEGTIAPGRFEAETILKSQYNLNGQQLEVDPD